MSDEIDKIYTTISNDKEGTKEEEKDEVHKLVCSTRSIRSRVNPNHCQFMEDHFDVNKWPHYNFKCHKQAGCHKQDRHVENEKQLLIALRWI